MTLRTIDDARANAFIGETLRKMSSRASEFGAEIMRLEDDGRISKARLATLHAAHEDLCLLICLMKDGGRS